jgi:hypothetical protein
MELLKQHAVDFSDDEPVVETLALLHITGLAVGGDAAVNDGESYRVVRIDDMDGDPDFAAPPVPGEWGRITFYDGADAVAADKEYERQRSLMDDEHDSYSGV